MTDRRSSKLVAGLWLVLASACKPEAPREDSPEPGEEKAEQTNAPAEAKLADARPPEQRPENPEAKAAAPVAPSSALMRAEQALAVKATVEEHPGFRLEPLLELYALAGAVGGPSWAAALDEPELVRDDDLDTAATCTPSADTPCALGLAFSETAKLSMLRLYVAAGPEYMTYKGAPRPKTVLVHTDAGHARVVLDDSAEHAWVIFAEPVETKAVTVEVVDDYPGRKDPRIHFAELEAFGPSGAKREPLVLDPTTAFVYYESAPWKDKGGGRSTVRMTWLSTFESAPLGEASRRTRWTRGAAVYGDRDDRFLLVQKVLSSTCEAPDPSWIIVDKETRMLFPLGKLAGGDVEIHGHPSGRGYMAVPRPGPDGTISVEGIRTVLHETEKNAFDRQRGRSKWALEQHFAEWGFDAKPFVQPAMLLDAWVKQPDSHCEALDEKALAGALDVAKEFGDDEPGEWWSCNVGDGHHMLVGRDRACGEKVAILLAQPGFTDIEPLAEFRGGEGPRVVAVRSDVGFPGALVEVGKDGGASADLVPVNIDFPAQPIVRGAGLTVRPPAACGACKLAWREPVAAPPAVEALPVDDAEEQAATDSQ